MSWIPCTSTTSHSKIKISDPGSKYTAVINNPTKTKHYKTRSDGCWIKEKIAADWILTCSSNERQLIVELKGGDVNHGTKQIIATAEALKSEGKIAARLAGLIVCTQYPKNDTSIQRARLEFARRFKGPIHAVTKSREFDFDRVLAFDGPG
jgi:hypothetical protein